jgi:hypothetical protein
MIGDTYYEVIYRQGEKLFVRECRVTRETPCFLWFDTRVFRINKKRISDHYGKSLEESIRIFASNRRRWAKEYPDSRERYEAAAREAEQLQE